MATISITNSNLGTSLTQLLMSDEIIPGADTSYELCKQLYLYHPLGKKMAELPLNIAMSSPREISVPESPEDAIVEAFNREWDAIGADKHIFNVMRLSRVYGIASIVYGALDIPQDVAIDPKDFYKLDLFFNILDPLNTAGSLVLNQNPNAPDFQKHAAIAVNGVPYHRSRSCVIMNEEPIYISYTNSAFGFVGRSVYQRALFPMKSFIQSMITDDMVTRKAGVIVAKSKQAGSIVNNAMKKAMGVKRDYVKESETGNVISISIEEDIASIDLKNADTGMIVARKNILDNIASAASMPAKMLNNETFAEGFGEGSEDAKAVADYINCIREDMKPLYDYFDNIVQYRAWNPEFYKTIQARFPEFKKISYTKAFYTWTNSFSTKWPNLLKEPDSEIIKVEDVKLKAIVAMLEVMMPSLDPENRALLIDWAANNFNDQKMLFKNPLLLDYNLLRDHIVKSEELMGEPAPFSREV